MSARETGPPAEGATGGSKSVPAIRIVSASAGSGKTHRLAEELKRALCPPEARFPAVAPEQVVAVTFTHKAAAELAERARAHLLEAGLPELAHRLAAARLGTVHAVCGRLLDDFAFELGLSPEPRVLDEAAAGQLLRRALGEVFSGGETAELAELAQRFVELDLREVVGDLVNEARGNALAPEELVRCAERSREGLLSLLDPPEDGERLERDLVASLDAFLAALADDLEPTLGTKKATQVAEQARARLASLRPLAWNDWAALAQLETGKAMREAAAAVAAVASRYLAHPRLRGDLARLIELAFDLARRTLEAYAERKREVGGVDFTDQLVLALELFTRPAVREQLRGELGLVLVDEFQDTNPLQLALFLALAGLARQSVWVGDQKQAIFGFLGADPSLMDAAIEAITATIATTATTAITATGASRGGQEPETLSTSYRSRPPLVALTSELFARAFSDLGLPESRARLRSVEGTESPARAAELGPCLERWVLEARRQEDDARALAAGVAELLSDPTVRVRDRESGATRALRPGDVAVLCRKNQSCLALAAELGRRGIRSALPRTGLLSTPEGQAARAALALWAAPRDAHAAAVLARLADYPADGEAWLAEALAAPRGVAFFERPRLRRLAAARAERPWADPVEALEAAIDAVDLRGLCLAWGRSEERLANLDALRSAAVAYRALCAAEGQPSTPVGLLARLDELAASRQDAWAAPGGEEGGEESVVLSTWHAAKGLEWTITVLCDLDAALRETHFGVFVEPAEGELDFTRPLAGRWLRYWPDPFSRSRSKSALHERVQASSAAREVRSRAEREALRLFYVGWTRARDRLVLAGRAPGKRGSPLVRGLAATLAEGGEPLLSEPTGNAVEWAGERHPIRVRTLVAAESDRVAATAGEGCVAAGPREHPPARLAPSQAREALAELSDGQVGELERIGAPLVLLGRPDPVALGSAMHRFLAADEPDRSRAERLALAERLLARWGARGTDPVLPGGLAPDDLLRAADALGAWLEAAFPGARRRREWPLAERLESGTVVAGNADLVLEVADGFVLVDHKLVLDAEPDLATALARYRPQLAAYAHALSAATGKKVLASYVHLPVQGVVAGV